MEVATLSAPVLMGATALTYWAGRKHSSRLMGGVRIAFLFVVLLVLAWVWSTTPSAAFSAPVWRHVSFGPAAAGTACWIVLEARRVARIGKA